MELNFEQLTLTTPALLFSAVSLILLAFTNRFLAYGALVRDLHLKFVSSGDKNLLLQIKNLRKRLYLTRAMQILGISSLLLCVITMFLIYVHLMMLAVYIFALALLLLILSLGVSAREIQISSRSIDLQLSDMERV